MAMLRRIVLCALMLGVAGLPAVAQNNQAKPNNTQKKNNNGKYPAPVDHSKSTAAKKAATEAAAKVKLAENNLATVSRELQSGFEQRADWAAAKKEDAEAQAAYDQARAKVLADLSSSGPYKAARDRKAQAEAARDAASEGDRVETATAVLHAGQEVTRLEVAAMEADPAASAAKARLKAAAQKMGDLQKELDGALRNSPKWQSARKELDDAQVQLTKANSERDTAIAAEAQAERQRAQRVDEINRERAARAEAERLRRERERRRY